MSNLIESIYEKTPFIYEIEGAYYAIGASVFCPVTDKAECDNLTLLASSRAKNNTRQIIKYTEKISRIAKNYRVDAREYLKTKEKLVEFLTKLETENPEAYKRFEEDVNLVETV